MSFDPDNEQAFTERSVSHNYARFHRMWVHNKFQSEKQGKEVGEYRDYVIIISPGAPKTEIDCEATEVHKREFSSQWKQYSDNKEQMDGGIPLELLPGMDKGRAAAFKSLYCMTIEQLANLSDAGCQQAGMGSLEWRARATKYLQTHTATSEALTAAQEQITSQQAQIDALTAQVRELIDRQVEQGAKRGKRAA